MEREWEHLMDQSFILQYYGKISIADQFNMTAEERSWYIERLVKEKEKQNEAEEKAFRSPQ